MIARESGAAADGERTEALFGAAMKAVAIEAVDNRGSERIALAFVADVAAGDDRQLPGDRAGGVRDRLLDEVAAGQQVVQREALEREVIPVDLVGNPIDADAAFPTIADDLNTEI